MDIQSEIFNELFVLYPVIIQGWVTPVKPEGIAQGGIPKVLYDGETQGLECLIDPWTEMQLASWTMAADDRVDLYVNDNPTPATGKTVAPGEEQQRVRLYLPHGWLNQGINRLYYKVTRVGGNEESSRDMLALYHLRLPESLDLIIPSDVEGEGVGPELAARGVTFAFTYSNRRHSDSIVFALGDTTVRFDVPNAPAPINLTLYTDTFQRAGDNPNAVAEFRVFDQLALPPTDTVSVNWQGATDDPDGSYSSPPRLVSAGLEIAVPRSVLAYSLSQRVSVSYFIERDGKTVESAVLLLDILPLPATALIAPKIVEADANNFLDVTAFDTKNATIHALLHTLIEAEQPCWLRLEGKKADGTAHDLTLWAGLPARVNSTWINQGFWPQTLANSYLVQLGHGTTLTLKYLVALDKRNIETNAVKFPDRVYTIKSVELVVPTLDRVLDSNGEEVPEGGWTVSTSLTLSGTASKGLEIEVFDDDGSSTVAKGRATADPLTGIWTREVTVAEGKHRLFARSLYHSGEVDSGARSFTVTADVAPTIDSITATDNGEEIPNGGTTVETAITLSGVAAKGQKVDVLDGITSKGQPTADPVTGVWTLLITELDKTTHVFVAKELYGAGQSSDVYRINVVAMQPPVLLSPAVTPIDVLAYEQGVILRVMFPEALPGQQAQLKEHDPLPGSKPFPVLALHPGKQTDFSLSSAFLATRRGSSRSFYWTLISDGDPVGNSPELTLVINAIAEYDPRLPTPNIAGETGDQLNIDLLPDNAEIIVSRWSFQESGNPVFMKLEGIDTEGNSTEQVIYNGQPHYATDGLSVAAPMECLRTLKSQSKLNINFGTKPEPDANNNTEIFFPARTYVFTANPSYTLENFDLLRSFTITAGQSIDSPLMKFACTKGTLFLLKLQDNPSNPPPPITEEMQNQALYTVTNTAPYVSEFTLHLHSNYHAVNFWYCAVNINNFHQTVGSIEFLDFQNQLLGKFDMVASPTPSQKNIEFSGKDIRKIRIIPYIPAPPATGTGFYFDTFKLYS
ncbi:hypothetical protein [Pseudomonas atacamensis]|uniref:hypothetical protein n=1 Tax=Pseudomonas atacamensis TaxID=2565368 RepID=UPI00381154C1